MSSDKFPRTKRPGYKDRPKRVQGIIVRSFFGGNPQSSFGQDWRGESKEIRLDKHPTSAELKKKRSSVKVTGEATGGSPIGFSRGTSMVLGITTIGSGKGLAATLMRRALGVKKKKKKSNRDPTSKKQVSKERGGSTQGEKKVGFGYWWE